MEHLIMDHVMSWYFGTSLALMGFEQGLQHLRQL